MQNGRYLYLAKFSNIDYYKFGISLRPLTRLENISNEIGDKDVQLFIFAWFDNADGTEQMLINRFRESPSRGKAREWKKLSHNDVNYIKKLIYEYSEKRNEGFQFNPTDQTVGKVKDIKRKEKSFYAANPDRFSGTTFIKPIKTFRITDENQIKLTKLVQDLDRTEGWILNHVIEKHLDGLAKMLDGSEVEKKSKKQEK